MFSAGSIQPQTLLQQLSPLINAVRNASQNIAINNRQSRASRTTASPAEESLQDVYRVTKTLHELGVKNPASEDMLAHLGRALDLPKVPPGPHVSTASFFENKNGFPKSLLNGASYSESASVPLLSLSSLAAGLTPHTFQQRTVRGFKTKRAELPASGFTPKRVIDDLPTLKFRREMKWPSTKVKQSEKLRQMMEETSQSPELKDKLHIAFAEGYLANDTKESDQGRWAKNILRLIQFSLLAVMLVLLFNSATALFSNMKLDVLKGERYEVNPEEISVTFADVKGVDEAKAELEDVVEFLRDPEKFQALGARLPKGVLLVGPPGVGKTLLARAVAGEAGVPFFHASGSEFDEIFVGTGAKRVRQLFDAAKMRAPCLIFIDEMDTVGHTRTSSITHPYANQTINQLLSEMDGFTQTEGVIVLGATNRKDNLDSALMRPGRFDVEVGVSPPDLKGRLDILELYLSRIKMGSDIDVEILARRTIGSTGADLKNMVNQAALKAAIDGDNFVSMSHMNYAMDKILMGPAKKSKIPDEETNLKTAFHEAGHTIVAYFTKDASNLHKVTILPRGSSLGHTSFIPVKEKYDTTKSQMLAHMDVAMGGRAAEEIIFGSEMITTGASADFQSATNIATSMVTKCGMSEKVGVRVFDDHEVYKSNDISPATAELIDSEIKRILQDSYDRAKHILKSHQTELNSIANALMQYETLDVDDIKTLMAGKKIKRALHLTPKTPFSNKDTPSKSKPGGSPSSSNVASAL